MKHCNDILFGSDDYDIDTVLLVIVPDSPFA